MSIFTSKKVLKFLIQIQLTNYNLEIKRRLKCPVSSQLGLRIAYLTTQMNISPFNSFSFLCFLLAIHRKQFHITLFLFHYFHSTSEVFAGLMLSPVLWHIHSMQRSGSVCRKNHLRFEIQLSHSNLSTAALPRDTRPLGARTLQIRDSNMSLIHSSFKYSKWNMCLKLIFFA